MSLSNINMFEFGDEYKANDWISWYKLASPPNLESFSAGLRFLVRTKMF